MFNVNFLARHNNKISRFLNRVINGCHIGGDVKLPKSIQLAHCGFGIFIDDGVKIGENVLIFQNTTIGRKDIVNYVDEKRPKIEDNVIIGANCIIVGDITIGKNSVIGAGSFIDKNIPENSCAITKGKLIIKKRK